ncbi:MAG TPA: TIGR04086 family membrane protein [Firmicutes bacterium]|jgi:putative membrane protein (TIGR04086 family)|nr:TIGR04086 family membrane protein [Bacillota bacterium]
MPSVGFSPRALVAGVGVALLATVLTSLVVGIALFVTPLPEHAVVVSSGFLGVFCIFVGSFWAVRREGRSGLLNGFLIGSIYVLACYGLASSFEMVALPTATLPLKLLIGAAAGAIGGMVGVAFSR